MSIQKASSSTFPPCYVRTRCKHQSLQLEDVCLAWLGGHRASSLAGEHPRKPGRRGASSTYGISHAYGVWDVQCGTALALQKELGSLAAGISQASPQKSQHPLPAHIPGLPQKCPPEPGQARGSETFSGTEHRGNFVWGPHPGLQL